MDDGGEHELTSDDKRILKYVADAAREEMTTRRGALKLAAVGLAGAGLGSAATGTVMGQAGQNDEVGAVGTSDRRVDVYANDVFTQFLAGADIAGASSGQLLQAQGGGDLSTVALNTIDAADLSGASGSDGQVLQTDGTSAAWMTSGGGGAVAASETDDGSDVTEYSFNDQGGDRTLLDITGSGIFLGGIVTTRGGGDGGSTAAEITVDGGATWTTTYVRTENSSVSYIPPIVFDSSLEIVCLEQGNSISGQGVVKQ